MSPLYVMASNGPCAHRETPKGLVGPAPPPAVPLCLPLTNATWPSVPECPRRVRAAVSWLSALLGALFWLVQQLFKTQFRNLLNNPFPFLPLSHLVRFSPWKCFLSFSLSPLSIVLSHKSVSIYQLICYPLLRSPYLQLFVPPLVKAAVQTASVCC